MMRFLTRPEKFSVPFRSVPGRSVLFSSVQFGTVSAPLGMVGTRKKKSLLLQPARKSASVLAWLGWTFLSCSLDRQKGECHGW